MKTKNTRIFLLALIILASGCESLRPHVGDVKVPVLLNTDTRDTGIFVQVNSPVYVSGEQQGKVDIIITNMLDEAVFVVVTGFDCLGVTFYQYDSRGKIEGVERRGGEETLFPSVHTDLLKRLSGSTRGKDGKRRLSWCCSRAYISGKLDPETLRLRTMTGAEATVMIHVRGYLCRNGQEFNEHLEVPITIVDGQPPVPAKR